jgi:polar amino acid transport system substrate-binding protein
MKKIMAIALSAAMLMGLSACGASGAPAATAAKTDAKSSYAGKKLIMATNAEFPPYEYHDGNDIVGIDVEIAKAIAEEMGAELEVSDIAFDSIIPAVQSDKADFGAAGMTITDDRKTQVDFSDTYATAIQSVIVKEDSAIQSVDDLKGKIIGVQQGTTGDIYSTGDFGEDKVQRFPKGADAVQALSTGKVDAVIIDNNPAKVFVQQTSGLKLLDGAYTEEQYAICVKKGNKELLDGINKALADLKSSGKLDQIVNTYIKAE